MTRFYDYVDKSFFYQDEAKTDSLITLFFFKFIMQTLQLVEIQNVKKLLNTDIKRSEFMVLTTTLVQTGQVRLSYLPGS